MDPFTTCLWFDTEGEKAARFYTELFPDSKIHEVFRQGETVLTVRFDLNGQNFLALNGGPQYRFSEAVSIMVNCETQDELDRYWDALTADGGEPGPCGWLKDRFGLSWQIVPAALPQLMGDPEKGQRVLAAVTQMGKLDIAELERAAEG
jgi:predicted 3-demethylubiquinone-9 3-methyltransferase (glyoxalase superfamily)